MGKSKRLIINDFSENNQETMYWAGFIFGDGTIDDKMKLQVHLSIKDVEHLRKLSMFIFGCDYVNIYSDNCHIQVTSNVIANNLKRFGVIPRKTYCSKLTIPNHYAQDFIRGYFDADGWVSISNVVRDNKYYYRRYCVGICSYLQDNLEAIRSYLQSTNKVNKCKNRILYELRFQAQRDVIKICKYLYHPYMSLRRKNIKLKEIIDCEASSNIEEVNEKTALTNVGCCAI